MSALVPPWTATIEVPCANAAAAERLLRVLAPEAAREVPRSKARLIRRNPSTVLLEAEAEDTGALRAALNAYLGWIRLALDTQRVAGGLSAGVAP